MGYEVEAVKIARQGIQACPNELALYRKLIDLLVKQSQVDQAITVVRQANASGRPILAALYPYLMDILEQSGHHQLLLNWIEQELEQAPNDEMLRTRQKSALAAQQRAAEQEARRIEEANERRRQEEEKKRQEAERKREEEGKRREEDRKRKQEIQSYHWLIEGRCELCGAKLSFWERWWGSYTKCSRHR